MHQGFPAASSQPHPPPGGSTAPATAARAISSSEPPPPGAPLTASAGEAGTGTHSISSTIGPTAVLSGVPVVIASHPFVLAPSASAAAPTRA
ncbi:hypothetical protein [Kitasatospora sp. NPDC050543]|uniref:hypothetical protein n=1 Tax=Kitasatospora sp. NPDC050543 TaxID=3364054 RepID=UPI0037AE77CF